MDGNANGWGAAPSFTPAPGFVADTGFTSDAGFSADTGFTPDASAGFTTGDFNPENVSKHANDDVPPDGGCRACGADGHFARDCPDKKPNTGECYNCGQVGHNKSECQNPRVEREFIGTCRLCEQPGHRAAECPSKPPTVCKACREEGHVAVDCPSNRLFAFYNVTTEVSGDAAWEMLTKADGVKDLDDIKAAVLIYAKAFPHLTLPDLERTFRQLKMKTYLIAKEQEVAFTHTIVNFQGKPDQKYVLSFQFSPEPRRLKQDEGWPASAEANLERLAEAGYIMDSFVPKCDNCGEAGHVRTKCEQEKREIEKANISCSNCNQEGHRARDCTQPRKAPGGGRGCRNCGQDGHMARECPEPPNLDNVECKNCKQMGHFARECPSKEPELCRNCGEEGHRAKDCTQERVMKCRNCDGEGHISRDCPEPKNMAKMQCRNCDEFGHGSRECPKPTDWSRVTCTNCNEKGHSYKRCSKPAGAADAAAGDGGW